MDEVLQMRCPDCHGLGYEQTSEVRDGAYIGIRQGLCKRCHGTGLIEVLEKR